MRRRVVTEVVECDLCERERRHEGYGWIEAGPVDICSDHDAIEVLDKCESCDEPEVWLWAGNCLPCWQKAMSLPRGKCGAMGSWRAACYHSCDQIAGHPDAHHCPICGCTWGLR